MKQRMSSEERREQLLVIMREMHQQAEDQQNFTAAKIAKEANISKVLFYRLVGSEFQMLRSQLEGGRRSSSEALQELRLENDTLRQQLKDIKLKLRTTAVEELDKAIQLLEEIEEENLQLRSEIKLLRRRLEEGGQVIIQVPTHVPFKHNLSIVSNDLDNK